MAASKQELLRALRDTATLMELTGENPFRCRAYEQGARILESLEGDPARWIASGRLPGLRGIGPALLERVGEFAESGRLASLDELRAQVPPTVLELLTVPGLGARKARTLWKELGIETLAQLEAAARDGRIAALPGFGKRSAEKILAAVEGRIAFGGRMTLETASRLAEPLLERLRGVPGATRVEIAGSLRRWRETVKDLDFVATGADPAAILAAFVSTSGVQSVAMDGPTRASIMLEGGIAADLRVVAAGQFAPALLYFTGSKEHNTALRGRARRRGLKLNEYGLFPAGNEAPLEAADEAALYRHLELDFIPPELRENTGEIEAAESGALPELVTQAHLRGVLHCHTTWSDGRAGVLELAQACQDAGYTHLAICDHSQSAAYAGGLKPADLLRQIEEIEHVRRTLRGFTLFTGSEVDTRVDGALDYDDELLARLDVVVASVHSRMSMDGAAMTDRICRAIAHPAVSILGHPTGRLLTRREPYDVDLARVFATAARHDVAIEINANPNRLDLDWRFIRAAREAGCRFAINPDAHTVGELNYLKYGVAIARKGWLGPRDVINTMSPTAFKQWLDARHSAQNQ